MTTKVSSAATALSLNRDVYNALATLKLSKADASTHYYVQRQLLEFRLAAATSYRCFPPYKYGCSDVLAIRV
jgi:hypothetical protein